MMIIAEPNQVKQGVAYDLKMRHLTRQEAGEMIGFGRQTMSNILSNGQYFTEKQAILFSLAFGYNKRYLMTGEGSLLSGTNPALIREAFEYRDRLLKILRETNSASSHVLGLVILHGADKCRTLINKMKMISDLVNTLDNFPPVSVNEEDTPPYDLSLMDAAEKLFKPIYNEIVDICKKEYGIDVDK